MANFEYIDENEAAALEAQRVAAESKSAAGERASYWEELLKDKFEVQQAEELNALGKRKRSRKQVCVFVDSGLRHKFVSGCLLFAFEFLT